MNNPAKVTLCHPEPVEGGQNNRQGRFVIPLIVIWALVMLVAFPAEAADPKGWGDFKWGMTQQQAAQAGAQPFVDAEGEKQFGLSSVEVLPGKTFQVRLEFFSHMGLNAVRVTLAPNTDCAQEVYENFLHGFRKLYGKEMESRDLDFPNSFYRSHDWIAGSTQIVLHHGCPKPGNVTATQPTTHIWYEKRRHTEPWNQ